MLSIGDFARAANISTRAVRHYESMGLIRATVRGENNYRYFDASQLGTVSRIRDLQSLGFSLEEVGEVLSLGTASMTTRLQEKLTDVGRDLVHLRERRDRLQSLLSISRRVDASQTVPLHERRLYMEAVKDEVVSGLQARQGSLNEAHFDYLRREKGLYDSPEKRDFIDAVKKCISFARDHDLTLGPGRGSCPSSIVLYGLGFSGIDPTRYDLIPERLSSAPPDIHIDVEFARGQPFVDFCRTISEKLTWGQITAFKMPLIDIVNGVHQRLGGPVDYQSISDDDEVVLGNIQRGEIDKIFLLDYSPNALVMRYENHLPDYIGTAKLKEFLVTHKVESFRDVINLISVWRPSHEEKIKRIERYGRAKTAPRSYAFLTTDLQAKLEKNYGLVLFHEDLMQIIRGYTDWDLERCSRLRSDIRFGRANTDLDLFRKSAPSEVFDLVMDETPWAYCKAHVMSFARITKQTAVLKSLHQQVYFSEIEKWEDRHGFVWDDIGIKIKGVSLLQH